MNHFYFDSLPGGNCDAGLLSTGEIDLGNI